MANIKKGQKVKWIDQHGKEVTGKFIRVMGNGFWTVKPDDKDAVGVHSMKKDNFTVIENTSMRLKDLLSERLPAQGFPEQRHMNDIQKAANVKLRFFKKGRVLYYISDDATGQIKLDPDLNGRFDMYMSNEFGKTIIDTERKESIEWNEILQNFKKHT